MYSFGFLFNHLNFNYLFNIIVNVTKNITIAKMINRWLGARNTNISIDNFEISALTDILKNSCSNNFRHSSF